MFLAPFLWSLTPFPDEVIALTQGVKPRCSKILEERQAKTRKLLARTDQLITLVTIITLILAIGLGLFIARTITRPILKLRDAADEIGKGKLDTKLDIKSNDEIGSLAASFKEMAERLSAAMEKEKKLLAATISASADNREKAEKLAFLNEKLQFANEELNIANEQIVKTKVELEKRLAELKRFNQLAVGRELKMKELKARIRETER